MQENRKLRNGLREVLIDLYKLKHGKQLTKKEANKIVETLHLDKDLLETKIEHIPLSLYQIIASRVENLDV